MKYLKSDHLDLMDGQRSVRIVGCTNVKCNAKPDV